CLVLSLGDDRPLFLSSTVKEDNDILAVDLANPDLFDGDRILIPRGTLHLFRSKFLWQAACYERVRLRNYGLAPLQITFSIHFENDFADIFEVRGTKRKQKGRSLEPSVEGGTAVLAYEGLDGVVRRSRLQFMPQPDELTEAEALYRV